MLKLSTKEFIIKSKEVHGDKYDYSKVNYINNKTKVAIICHTHGVFWQIPKHHTDRKQGCSKCSNKYNYSTKEFIKKAKEIHGDKYDYSEVEYSNTHTKVCIICPKHGEFWQRPNNHINSKAKCPKCKFESNSIKRTLSTKEFIIKAKEIHDNKYDYSKVKYINTDIKVTIICPKHGEFKQTPHSHLKQGCNKCGIKIRSMKRTFSTIDFIKRAKVIHGDKYDYSKVIYKDNNTKVTIICPEHGEFYQRPNDHTSNKNGCLLCANKQKESKNLTFIKNYLKENQIEFYEEVTFPELEYIKPLRIDLVIPKFNLYIEYDGEQHFKNTFSNDSNCLKKTKIRDQAKNSWALEHKINFLRIPYWLKERKITILCTLLNKGNLKDIISFIKKCKLYFIEDNSHSILNESHYKNF